MADGVPPESVPPDKIERPSVAARELEHGARQLRRLEFLTDVVFGLVILRIFTMLPKPEASTIKSVGALFEGRWIVLGIIAISLTFTIVYWIQHNAVFGALEKTDTRHTTLSILQIFALMMFLYSVKLGIEFDGDRNAMIFESVAAAVMGLLSLINWRYARKAGLVHPDATKRELDGLTTRLLPEPITAIVTCGTAFLGPMIWTISWFAVGPIVHRVLKHRGRTTYPTDRP